MSERSYPDMEIKRCMKQCDAGDGWWAWISEDERFAIAALRWKADQGDQLPEELEELRDAIAQFGLAPVEQAVARVIGLEAAFAEIAGLMGGGGGVARIQEIVRTCVRFSGEFGTDASRDDNVRRIIDKAFEGSRVEFTPDPPERVRPMGELTAEDMTLQAELDEQDSTTAEEEPESAH